MLKRKGFYKYIKDSFQRWSRRFRFYCSYKGSIREVVRRFRRFFRKKGAFKTEAKVGEEVEIKIKEIEMVKKLFEEEIKLLK
jgi:hypothetical protein